MDKYYEWSEDEMSYEDIEEESERSEDEMPTESDIEFIDDSELSEEDWSSISESKSQG